MDAEGDSNSKVKRKEEGCLKMEDSMVAKGL